MVACLHQGAGLDASAVPTYLELATYRGAPVFVGAFVTQPPAGSGSTSHLLLVVVTRPPVARVKIPQRVPTGYHTWWIPAADPAASAR